MKKKILIILFIILSIILSFLFDKNIKEKNRENIETNLNIIARKTRNEITNTRELLGTVTSFPQFRDFNVEQMEEILTTLIQKHREIKALYIIDKYGEQSANITQFPDIYLDRSSHIWFADIVKGNHSGFISDVNFIGKAKSPSITMAVLMRDEDFEINGMIAAEIDVAYIFQHKINFPELSWLSRIFVTNNNFEIIYDSEQNSFQGLKIDIDILDKISSNNNLSIYSHDLTRLRLRNIPEWRVIFLTDNFQNNFEIYFNKVIIILLLVPFLIFVFPGFKNAKRN
ncbi:MAG: cache domain-containing protein [Candidatus Muiribacteriota bacterium]